MATQLEQVGRFNPSGNGKMFPRPNGGYVKRSAAITAARLDAEDAYRRGVEDGKSLAYLDKAGEILEWARNRVEIANGPLGHYEVKDDPQVWDAANELKDLRDKAFHGARGIARVEIRQRLERLKEGNGNER